MELFLALLYYVPEGSRDGKGEQEERLAKVKKKSALSSKPITMPGISSTIRRLSARFRLGQGTSAHGWEV